MKKYERRCGVFIELVPKTATIIFKFGPKIESKFDAEVIGAYIKNRYKCQVEVTERTLKNGTIRYNLIIITFGEYSYEYLLLEVRGRLQILNKNPDIVLDAYKNKDKEEIRSVFKELIKHGFLKTNA